MSSFVTCAEPRVAGKITRSGLDTRSSPPPASTVAASAIAIALGFQPAPAAGAVVCDDLSEHLGQSRRVDLIFAPESHCPRGLVVVPTGDDALRVGHDPAVVEEQVDVVLGGE